MPSETPHGATSSDRLNIPAARRVLLCVGPGGVGKTTVAAAVALTAAQQGRKVVVVTIDPSRRLAQALGLTDPESAAGDIVRVPGTGDVGAPLDALLLDTKRVFDTIVRGYAESPEAAQRILSNPIYGATAERLGGALEYAAIARVHLLYQEGSYDLIVLDTPPTANAIEFLEAPSRIREVLANPAAKFLASSSRMGMKFLGLASSVMLKAFETLGGGAFIGQLGQFLSDFGLVLSEFQRRAGDVEALLVSRQTGVVLATAATDFSLREAKDFLAVLRDRGMNIDGVILNRTDPPVPAMPHDQLLRQALAEQPWYDDTEPDRRERIVTRVREVHADVSAQAQRVARIQSDLDATYHQVPVCVIPRLSPPPTGLEALHSMGAGLMGDPAGDQS